MVLKPPPCTISGEKLFYSSVIVNGTETMRRRVNVGVSFYSSVILNGTETNQDMVAKVTEFYSSVILNGTETFAK